MDRALNPVAASTTVVVDISDVGDVLHDAILDLHRIRSLPRGYELNGWIERRKYPFVPRFYDFRVMLPGATRMTVQDDAGTGELMVEDVRVSDGVAIVRGATLAEVTIWFADSRVEIQVGAMAVTPGERRARVAGS